MISSIRLTAVAAIVAATVLPAQATPLLSLDFDALATPLLLGGQEFNTASGQLAVTFGANAKADVANPDPLADYVPDSTGGKSHGVFVVNQLSSFKIDVAPGFKVDLLTLDFAITDLSISVKVIDVNGSEADGTFYGTSAAWHWSENVNSIDLSQVGLFKSIEFSSPGLFAIDNLQFDLSTCTPNCDAGGGGSTVPEPASIGIVAIALLGAGISSRRRQRAPN